MTPEQKADARLADDRFVDALWDNYGPALTARGLSRPITGTLLEKRRRDAHRRAQAVARARLLAEARTAAHRPIEFKTGPIAASIIHAVSRWFDVSEKDILGRSRQDIHVSPRFTTMRLLRDIKWEDGQHRFSLPHIGKIMGDRDHSTVKHAIDTFPSRARKYPEMRQAYLEISAALNSKIQGDGV